MKLLSAMFDAVLIPVAIVRDAVDISNFIEGRKSFTRQVIEKIEDNLS